MTTFLIVLGSVLGYFAVGALYARSQAVRIYQHARKEWRYDDMIRDIVFYMMAWRVAFWPWAVVQDAVRGPVVRWIMRPVTERRERAAQLHADANRWAEEARHEVDGEKKAMAKELARILREQAKEAEL